MYSKKAVAAQIGIAAASSLLPCPSLKIRMQPIQTNLLRPTIQQRPFLCILHLHIQREHAILEPRHTALRPTPQAHDINDIKSYRNSASSTSESDLYNPISHADWPEFNFEDLVTEQSDIVVHVKVQIHKRNHMLMGSHKHNWLHWKFLIQSRDTHMIKLFWIKL